MIYNHGNSRDWVGKSTKPDQHDDSQRGNSNIEQKIQYVTVPVDQYLTSAIIILELVKVFILVQREEHSEEDLDGE